MSPKYSHNRIFAAACLGMLLFGIVFLSLGSVSNMLAERFTLDNNAIGTLTALLPLGILIGSALFGPVVDRFGYRWLLAAAALVVGVALEGLAFAGSVQHVQFFIFLIGFGGGALNGATNALTADVSEGQRGAKLSLLGVFFGAGATTIPAAIALLSHVLPLSTIVAAIGSLVLVPVVYVMSIEFPPPKQRTEKVLSWEGLRFLSDPFFLLATLALAIQSGMEGMSNDWMTRYFKNVKLHDAADVERYAQLALIALTSAMMLARLALSRLLVRMSSPAVLFASSALAACGAILLRMFSGYEVSLFGVLMIGAGLAAAFPVVLGYIGDRFPLQSGTAFSTIFVLALVGNMTINKTFGHIAARYGIAQYPVALLGLLAVSAILLAVMKRSSAKNQAPT